jgi:hypothetical protein
MLAAGLAAFTTNWVVTAGDANSAFAAANPFAQLQRMSSTELANAHGGFVTPGGLNINVGVQVQTSVNGQLLTPASSPATLPNGNAVPVATAQLVQIASQGQVSSVVQYATGSANTVAQNMADNAVIQQLTRLNISVNNFSQVQSVMNLGFIQLLQQQNFALLRTLQ